MTRKIKAQDVKPGMEIEWTNRGVTYRCLVDDVPDPAFDGQGNQDLNIIAAGWPRAPKKLSLGCFQEVTVLKEAQPTEPTAFGACVEAGGVWFVRLDVRDFSDPYFQPWQSESLIQCTWAEVCDQGLVTVVNADPFATPAQAETEPQVWDRWEDVPKLTPVRLAEPNGEPVYRKAVGEVQRQTRDGNWWPSVLTTDDMLRSPGFFTEVL